MRIYTGEYWVKGVGSILLVRYVLPIYFISEALASPKVYHKHERRLIAQSYQKVIRFNITVNIAQIVQNLNLIKYLQAQH